MFEAAGIARSHGARKLFGPLDIRVNDGDRIALVGPNGSGKSTILKILAGEEVPDEGEVRGRKSIEVGYLPQELEAVGAGTLLSFVENASGELRDVREELREAEGRLSEGESSDELVKRYGVLQERFERLGGYRLRSEAGRILSGLGFAQTDFHREVASFSGGWRMRALLGRILLKNPEIVLLDEPTNHLDIVSLVWLEDYIRQSPSAFVIVSHDVSFLDRMVNSVLALENSGGVRVKGNYTNYANLRRERVEQEQASWERKQRQFAEERKFIDRFRAKNTKAAQVQSRLRRLEKEEEELAPPTVIASSRPNIEFPQPERSGHEVAKLEGIVAGYGDRNVYDGLDFTLYRGRKIVLIGPNGAGKSTFMKLLAGVLEPKAGKISFGQNVQVSYFSQHQMEQLSPRRTVLDEILLLPGLRTEREARTLLGAFLFSGDDVEKPVEVLSGGEKSRLVLAKIMTRPGNLLLMDEPTNHLDIESCEVLKRALSEYKGTLAVITHDRDLIDRVADSVCYVESASVKEYPGGYGDFQRLRALEAEATKPTHAAHCDPLEAPQQTKGKDARRRDAERRERWRKLSGPLKSEVERLENATDGCHARQKEVEALLADPAVYGEPVRAAELSRELKALEEKGLALMSEWEEAAARLEKLECDFAAGEGD